MRLNRLAAVAFVALALGVPASAERLPFESFRRGQSEFAINLAYGANHRIPAATRDRVAFDMVRFRAGWFSSPRTEAAAELALERQSSDNGNHGISAAIGLRRYLSVRGNTAIACDFSVGAMRFEKRLISQSTRINFTEQIGIALQYGIGTKSALTLEYTFSHNSNAGLKLPNLGINASIISLGYSWYP